MKATKEGNDYVFSLSESETIKLYDELMDLMVTHGVDVAHTESLEGLFGLVSMIKEANNSSLNPKMENAQRKEDTDAKKENDR